MNWLKIFVINFIFILFVLIVIEFCNYQTYKSKYMDLFISWAQNYDNPNQMLKKFLPRYKKPVDYNFKNNRDDSKFVIYGNSTKRPIITIGCSYTYGTSLSNKETLSGQLSKVTGRTVYNLGLPGTGPQTVYEQLKDTDIKNEIPDAEYIVYLFIYDHIFRQFRYVLTNSSIINPTYEIDKNGNFTRRKHFFPKFLYNFFSIRNYLDYKTYQDGKDEINKGFPLFFKTMEECLKISKEKYPNLKFVLIEFPQASMCRSDYKEKTSELSDDDIKKLEDMGIIYINAEKLVGHKFRDVEKYRINDKDHPNAKVWEEMAPALKARLKL